MPPPNHGFGNWGNCVCSIAFLILLPGLQKSHPNSWWRRWPGLLCTSTGGTCCRPRQTPWSPSTTWGPSSWAWPSATPSTQSVGLHHGRWRRLWLSLVFCQGGTGWSPWQATGHQGTEVVCALFLTAGGLLHHIRVMLRPSSWHVHHCQQQADQWPSPPSGSYMTSLNLMR